MIRIEEILDGTCILTGLTAPDKATVLRTMTDRLEALGRIGSSEEIHHLLMERESLMTTGVRSGFAFPHAFNRKIESSFAALGVVSEGVDFASLDGQPVYYIFLLLGPPDNQPMHLRALARISHLTGQPDMLEVLRAAHTPEALLEVLRDSEMRLTAFHPNTPDRA